MKNVVEINNFIITGFKSKNFIDFLKKKKEDCYKTKKSKCELLRRDD